MRKMVQQVGDHPSERSERPNSTPESSTYAFSKRLERECSTAQGCPPIVLHLVAILVGKLGMREGGSTWNRYPRETENGLDRRGRMERFILTWASTCHVSVVCSNVPAKSSCNQSRTPRLSPSTTKSYRETVLDEGGTVSPFDIETLLSSRDWRRRKINLATHKTRGMLLEDSWPATETFIPSGIRCRSTAKFYILGVGGVSSVGWEKSAGGLGDSVKSIN